MGGMGELKRLVELIGLATIVALSAVFLMGTDRVVDVPCGQDLDATVNADDPTIGIRFSSSRECAPTPSTQRFYSKKATRSLARRARS
jgi:hypothetical protein